MTTKLKLKNREIATIRRVEAITDTDYELEGDYIEPESLLCAIEDLILQIDRLVDDISELENDIENNYELKHVDPYEEIGMSERDFI